MNVHPVGRGIAFLLVGSCMFGPYDGSLWLLQAAYAAAPVTPDLGCGDLGRSWVAAPRQVLPDITLDLPVGAAPVPEMSDGGTLQSAWKIQVGEQAVLAMITAEWVTFGADLDRSLAAATPDAVGRAALGDGWYELALGPSAPGASTRAGSFVRALPSDRRYGVDVLVKGVDPKTCGELARHIVRSARIRPSRRQGATCLPSAGGTKHVRLDLPATEPWFVVSSESGPPMLARFPQAGNDLPRVFVAFGAQLTVFADGRTFEAPLAGTPAKWTQELQGKVLVQVASRAYGHDTLDVAIEAPTPAAADELRRALETMVVADGPCP